MFGGAIDLMQQAAKQLGEVEHELVDARTRVSAIADVRRALDQLECQWLLMVGEADRREDAAAVDHLTTKSMLCHRVSMSDGAAGQAIGFARKLHKLPCTREAFAAGAISAEHAKVIVHPFTAARSEALAPLEATFVEQAADASPEELRNRIKYVTDAIDGDGGSTEFMDQYEQRRFDIARTFGGVVVGSFVLDPEMGDRALTVFNWLVDADRRQTGAEEQPRTPTQRRADAFGTMLNLIRDNAELAEVGGTHSRRNPPHASVCADIEVIERRAGAELAATVRSETVNGTRLGAETLRRITCDATISRIITDGPGQILDVGRQTRTISAAMRKAVTARDKHCQGRNCKRPPGFCQVHHKRFWADGGETNLEDLELKCDIHHIEDHEATHARYRKRKR